MKRLNADSVMVSGNKPLKGEVYIHGAKNAVLPILASTLLFKEEVVLYNVPDLIDIRNMLDILQYIGAEYKFEQGVVTIDPSGVKDVAIPEEISNKLRASSLVMGPMLARFKRAEVGLPGGCSIGERPLDLHYKGFEKLGAKVELEETRVHIYSENSMQGMHTLSFPSVGATENLIMAAALSEGTTVLENVAKEPEIMDMINFLNKAGARIKFADVNKLEIEGVSSLRSINYKIKPDRIEAGTFLMAAFATKGHVKLKGVNAKDLDFVLHKLRDMGAEISNDEDSIEIKYTGTIKATDINTAIYPGFPTDLQPQMSVLLLQAEGDSKIVENIFENRFTHLEELKKMKANVMIDDKEAILSKSNLRGAIVDSFDLRGAASMIIAGLCCEGPTRVNGMRHLHRGYDSFIEKLQELGADIVYM